ncbi:MAG TPA: porin, partial [Polyangiaceae bacterium]|nr:porin [Polyangiaceae bacterium]
AAYVGLMLYASVLPARAQDAAQGAPPQATPAPDSDEPREKKGDTGARSDDDFDSNDSLPMTVGARLMAGFEHRSERPAGAQTDPAQKEYGFTIRQIRLRVKGDLAERFRVNVSFDLSDALEPEAGAAYDQPPYLRTATLEYRPSRALRVQVGRFKRPFSHLELESASDLPILRRGLFNGLALEDNQWGDRAVGVMASGRLKEPKLRWYLSLTNPNWSPTLPTEGVDVIGRVEWTILKGLVLGANAGYKRLSIGQQDLDDFGYGGDVTLKLGDAHFLLEANDVTLPFETGRPRGRGALFMFDYELGLAPSIALQPTFFAEYADADTEISQNESLRLVLGLNLLAYSGFRIMPQVQLVRSIGDTSADNPWPESETLSLIFSLVL